MCLLCNDEKIYRTYMDHLDALKRRGETADPDKALDAVFEQFQAEEKVRAADPRNDRTLSPFFCSAVDK
ncbi:MAG: hypothetical protein BGN91_14075 [Nitrobacter sp. 62-13]|uniref:hypothetical protein n=1 Tax=Nitrobacter sp. 62-13 TaxID=1895797 RepID=UPI000962682E|nr:hypothetical protein [Nitrobacter sp. 62-13]OJU29079.1 MAG: hypothetical protein BGN91_14075 [Nitrobacter sp. 62-13]